MVTPKRHKTNKVSCHKKSLVLISSIILVDFFLNCYFQQVVLQGDVLAPYLFIVVDYVISRSEGDFGFIYKNLKNQAKAE